MKTQHKLVSIAVGTLVLLLLTLNGVRSLKTARTMTTTRTDRRRLSMSGQETRRVWRRIFSRSSTLTRTLMTTGK